MQDAERYIESSYLQRRDALYVIDEFTDDLLTMHGKCIDIGCGPGNVTKELILPKLPSDAVIVGADVCEAMIDRAKLYCKGEDRLSFLQLNIEAKDLPITEIGQYDNALSFYCLHWCQNTRRTFENIFKLLRPGGKALVVFLSFNNGFEAYIKMRENPKYSAYMEDAPKFLPPFQRCPNPRANLKKIIEEVGFEIIHCSEREKTFVHKNMKTLKANSLAVNPFLNRIPENLIEDFTEEMMQIIASCKIPFINKNGETPKEYSFLDTYRVLVAYLKKPAL